MEEKQNLIARTINHLKTKLSNTKICKRIAALTLATAMTVGISFTAGCNKDNPTPDSSGSGSYSTSVPGENQDYSDLLHSVEDDPYYQSLAENVGSIKDQVKYQLNQHPYGFLESKGYNVNAIKNGTLTCQTFSFIKDKEPNRLYISTRVQSKPAHEAMQSHDIADHYLISYDLTKQEMADYIAAYDQQYVYANFLNDAISKKKKATIHQFSQTDLYSGSDKLFYMLRGLNGKLKSELGSIKEFVLTGANAESKELYFIGFWQKELSDNFKKEQMVNLTITNCSFVNVLDILFIDYTNSDSTISYDSNNLERIRYFNSTLIGYKHYINSNDRNEEDDYLLHVHSKNYHLSKSTFSPDLTKSQ